jgi:hypothetical protein
MRDEERRVVTPVRPRSGARVRTSASINTARAEEGATEGTRRNREIAH